MPQEFKDASIVHLRKGKGNKLSYDNDREVSLLATANKILARVLLNWLILQPEDSHLSKSQYSFRKV